MRRSLPGMPAGHRRTLGSLLVVLVPLLAANAAHAAPLKALVGGRLIDGYGGAPLENSVVLIEGDRIKAVGRVGEVQVPAEAEVISTEGMSVLPGLWDMHVHLMIVGHGDYEHWDKTYPPLYRSTIMPAAAKQLLMAGVTSARDLGAPLDDILAIREGIKKGEIPGPTLYVSGPFLQHEPYPGTELFRWGIKGPDDAQAKVKKLADAGVDVIKLIDQDQMTMDEVRAVVDEAHKRKLPVVAHSHRVEEIRRGLQAGVDCFEHTGLGTAPEYPADVYEMMKGRANTLFWTPSGVPMNFHSDSTWREIDAWVNVFGVPAMDALRAATFWPAVSLKVEKEVGTVTPGKRADVIAVRGDVLRHVDLLQNVDVVVKGGVRYK